jgi:DNA polymerase-3 subunit delta'
MKPLLHTLTETQLRGAVRDAAGGYIFHGQRSQGKATTAMDMARRLNCRGDEPATCGPCRQFEAGMYPDLIVIAPEGRPSISIEQVRQLNHTLSLSPYYADGVRMVVVDGAHLLTMEAQNALLKVIEEPPPRTRFILVAERLEALAPTVRSRLAAIYFPPVTDDAVAAMLVARGLDESEAQRLAGLAGGAPGTALRLAASTSEAGIWTDLEAAMTTALTPSLFDRFVLAKRLADEKTDLVELATRFHRRLVTELRRGGITPQVAARRLGALEHFRRGLGANVMPRVALERLMVEL